MVIYPCTYLRSNEKKTLDKSNPVTKRLDILREAAVIFDDALARRKQQTLGGASKICRFGGDDNIVWQLYSRSCVAWEKAKTSCWRLLVENSGELGAN